MPPAKGKTTTGEPTEGRDWYDTAQVLAIMLGHPPLPYPEWQTRVLPPRLPSDQLARQDFDQREREAGLRLLDAMRAGTITATGFPSRDHRAATGGQRLELPTGFLQGAGPPMPQGCIFSRVAREQQAEGHVARYDDLRFSRSDVHEWLMPERRQAGEAPPHATPARKAPRPGGKARPRSLLQLERQLRERLRDHGLPASGDGMQADHERWFLDEAGKIGPPPSEATARRRVREAMDEVRADLEATEPSIGQHLKA